MTEWPDMSERAIWKPVHRRLLIGMTTLVAVVAAIWFLKTASVFTMPLAAAFFLTILVRPIHVFLGRNLHGPLRWFSLPITGLAILAVLAMGLGLLWFCIVLVLEAAPRYAEEFNRLLRDVQNVADAHGINLSSRSNNGGLAEYAVGFMTSLISSLTYIIAMLTLVFFLSILLLVEWEEIQRRARNAISDSSSRGAVDTLNAVAAKIRLYLIVRTAISALTGITAWITLYLLDVDLALLWGVMVFLLNYVPNIGSIISIIPPALFAALQHDVWWAILTWSALGAIQLFIGNYIDPRVEARTLQVSSLLVLISIIFWGWIWGIPGMILGVPMTITMITIFSHIKPMQPLATLLSSEDKRDQ